MKKGKCYKFIITLNFFLLSCNYPLCPKGDIELDEIINYEPECICPECGERNCGLSVFNLSEENVYPPELICPEWKCKNNCGYCPRGEMCNKEGKCIPGGCTDRCDEEIFVPAGYLCFTPERGSNPSIPCEGKEWVEAFYIDKYEVTIRRYRECYEAGVCFLQDDSGILGFYYPTASMDILYDPKFDNYPMIGLNYFMLEQFCRWEGKRLPTWQEWMRAACGPCERDGNSSCSPEDFVLYPWGNEDDEKCTKANTYGCVGFTQPVGSYPEGASFWGLMDTFGNAAEWLKSFEGSVPYHPNIERGRFYPYILNSFYSSDSNCILTIFFNNKNPSNVLGGIVIIMGGRCARFP